MCDLYDTEELEQAEMFKRIIVEVIQENRINSNAFAKYAGQNVTESGNIENFYYIEGDRNFYGWTCAELKAASLKTGIQIILGA